MNTEFWRELSTLGRGPDLTVPGGTSPALGSGPSAAVRARRVRLRAAQAHDVIGPAAANSSGRTVLPNSTSAIPPREARDRAAARPPEVRAGYAEGTW